MEIKKTPEKVQETIKRIEFKDGKVLISMSSNFDTVIVKEESLIGLNPLKAGDTFFITGRKETVNIEIQGWNMSAEYKAAPATTSEIIESIETRDGKCHIRMTAMGDDEVIIDESMFLDLPQKVEAGDDFLLIGEDGKFYIEIQGFKMSVEYNDK